MIEGESSSSSADHEAENKRNGYVHVYLDIHYAGEEIPDGMPKPDDAVHYVVSFEPFAMNFTTPFNPSYFNRATERGTFATHQGVIEGMKQFDRLYLEARANPHE